MKERKEQLRPEAQLDFWLERLTSPSFVYVVQGWESGPVKIGLAKDVRRRMAELQTAMPYELKLLHVLPGGASLERELHRRMGSLAHMLGEWFDSEDEDAELVLLLVEALANRLVSTYDGDGEMPVIPPFNELQTLAQLEENRQIIASMYRTGHDYLTIGEHVDMTASEVRFQVEAMKASDDWNLPDRPKKQWSPRGPGKFASVGYNARQQRRRRKKAA